MIKIRLSKTGAKNSPSYRVVAIDSKKKNEGLYLEVLGQYDPVKKHGVIDKEKLKKWHWRYARHWAGNSHTGLWGTQFSSKNGKNQ